ncbi:MAG: hypothetical protein J6B85_04460 [Lachnospiraceae bacterium]|nr:hypothetical protein [Lachnospiraceae bacterium]
MARSTLGMEITVCPNCHYVAHDIAEPVSEETKNFVLSDAAFQTDCWAYSVQAYRNLMRIAVLEERFHDAFSAYLKAAWIEEGRDRLQPSPIRQEVLQFFLEHEKELEFDDDTRLCMRADLLRRTGHFKEVIELTESANTSDAQTDLIMHYQKHLSENKDVRCYTIGFARRWQEETGFISSKPEKEVPTMKITFNL